MFVLYGVFMFVPFLRHFYQLEMLGVADVIVISLMVVGWATASATSGGSGHSTMRRWSGETAKTTPSTRVVRGACHRSVGKRVPSEYEEPIRVTADEGEDVEGSLRTNRVTGRLTPQPRAG